jgi:hypothetical protein
MTIAAAAAAAVGVRCWPGCAAYVRIHGTDGLMAVRNKGGAIAAMAHAGTYTPISRARNHTDTRSLGQITDSAFI